MIRDLSKYARRVALGAMAALALFAGSATLNPAAAVEVYNPLDGTTVSMSNGDYAQQYAKASAMLNNGGLVGVCFSTGGYNAGKCSRQMTMFEAIVFLNQNGSGGRSSVGTNAA